MTARSSSPSSPIALRRHALHVLADAHATHERLLQRAERCEDRSALLAISLPALARAAYLTSHFTEPEATVRLRRLAVRTGEVLNAAPSRDDELESRTLLITEVP